MNKKVFLIRHGEVEAKVNKKGERLIYDGSVHLNQLGKEQIERLGGILRKKNAHIQQFYTSPYMRAIETTQTLHQFFPNADIIEIDGIKDAISDGAIGFPLDLAVKGLKIPRLPTDETFQQTAERVWSSFKEILESSNGKNIAVVSHGHPIRMIKALLTEDESIKTLSMLSTKEFQSKNYLSKAEAWVFTLNPYGDVVSTEFITTNDKRSPSQEREN